jgi:ribosome assembly protein 4
MDGSVRLWDPEAGRPVATLTGHTSPVQALVAVPYADGTSLLASASDDGAIIIWKDAGSE